MTAVQFSPLAIEDLEQIGDYVAVEDALAASRLIGTLRRSAQELVNYPRRYPLVAGRADDGTRMRPVGSYLIFYRVDDKDGVVVLRVLHAARDRDPLLGP